MVENNSKTLGKTFSLIYIYIFLIGLVIGLLYITNITSIGFHKVNPPLPDSTIQKSDFTLEAPKQVSAVDLNNLLKPTDSLVEEGKNIFQSTCTACHGADGKGDGPAAGGLIPAPRNFTKNEGWINGPTISGIFKTITEGISGSGMASFSQLSPEDKFALAHYIRQTFVSNPPQDTKQQINALDRTYSLSKGQVSAGQIPIEDAMQLVINEDEPRYKEISTLANLISSQKDAEGSKLFKMVTKNSIKALTILSDSDKWKADEKEFINIITNNVGQDGFNDNVFTLTDNQWDILFGYLRSYF